MTQKPIIRIITNPRPTKASLLPLPAINAKKQNLAEITDEVWRAIKKKNQPARYFRYGNCPCRLERDDNDRLQPVPLSEHRLRYELAQIICWYQLDRGGNREPARPPVDVVKNVLATPNPALPILNRVVEVPVFASDGTLQAEPGYHEAGRIYYAPASGLMIPPLSSNPTDQDIQLALSLVFDELLVNFPFVNSSDSAHALALFLLPYVRDLIFGPTPNHLVESPMPGSGKDLLVEVCLRPALGPGALGILAQAKDEEEWRRRITACLRQATGVILIGNVTLPLDSGVLSSALTAFHWNDRILGKNEILTLPVRVIWTTTANNPILSNEIARRSVRIRIDPKCSRPWERKEFKHPDLRGWTDQHRGELIRAALVLVHAWVAAGKPLWRAKSLGSYEHWTAVMGGILDVVGIEGFLDNLHEFYEEAVSTEYICWPVFIRTWFEEHGSQEICVSDLIPLAVASGIEFRSQDDNGQRVSLGMRLNTNRDRVIGNHQIVRAGKRDGAIVWRLEELDEKETTESSEHPLKKEHK